MEKNKIAILGGGNIGTSLARGLIKSGQYKVDEIILSEKREPRITFLKDNGFYVTEDNTEAVSAAGTVVMAVKPQQFETLREEIKTAINSHHLLISTITGITHRDIETAFGPVPNIRIMPNTALEICESMICMFIQKCNPCTTEFDYFFI